MRKLGIATSILALLVIAFGIVMTTTGVSWFGLLMVATALTALFCAFWPERGDNREEGNMIGCINYETDGESVVLSLDLENLAVDAGLPKEVMTEVKKSVNDDKSVDYYFVEIYPECDDAYFLKRLVLVRVDAFGNLKSLNVLLNGVSYEAILDGCIAKDLEVYLDGELMMRLALADFATLVMAFSADARLGWPKVGGDDLYGAIGN